MDRVGVLFRAWTYHPVTNFLIVCWLDMRSRLDNLLGKPMTHPLFWDKPFLERVATRYDYRHQAADIRKRHELAKYCSICDDEDL